jgi:hypothetical protein
VPLAFRILCEGTWPEKAGQTLTWRDQATAAVLAEIVLDAQGRFSAPLPYGLFLQGLAAGHGGGTGALIPGAQSGGAGGDAEATGTLTQAQPLAGTAAGDAEAAAAQLRRDQGLAGAAGGDAEGTGAITQEVPGSLGGAAGGDAEATGTLSQSVGLGGAAGGAGGAGPSTAAQAKPIAGSAGGVGGAAGTVAVGAGLSGAAAGAGGASGTVGVEGGGDPTTISDAFTGTNGSAPSAAVWDSVVDEYATGFTAQIQSNKLRLTATGSEDGEGYPVPGGGVVTSVDLSRGGAERTIVITPSARSGASEWRMEVFSDPNNYFTVAMIDATHAKWMRVVGGTPSEGTLTVVSSYGQMKLIYATNGDITASVGATTLGTLSGTSWGDGYSVRLRAYVMGATSASIDLDDFSVT